MDDILRQISPLHVGISVPDMDQAVRWYQEVFGCRLKSDRYLEALHSRVVFLYLNDFQIELFQHDNYVPLPEIRKEPNQDIAFCGTKHICFAVNDMGQIREHLDACHVDLASKEMLVNGNKVLFIRDCAGNLIELIQEIKR